MNNENANLPAYPFKKEGKDYMHEGLTKRELIAAMSMQGMLAHNGGRNKKECAKSSVDYADELLNQLSKT